MMITDIYNSIGEYRGYYDHGVGAGLLEDWLDSELLESVRSDFISDDDPRWNWVSSDHERMFRGSDPAMWSTSMRDLLTELRGPDFTELLQDLIGVDELRPEVGNGGYRLYRYGGFQSPHIYKQPDEYGWHRVYVEVFLNREWEESDGGRLILRNGGNVLWDVLPSFNRIAVVRTSNTTSREISTAKHNRGSVVMNYYSDTPPGGSPLLHQTIWATG